MSEEKTNNEEQEVNYPHEVLMAEKKISFEELTPDIQEAIEDFDNLYEEIEKEEQEATSKKETFELDDARRKKLIRYSEQAATMIYGYIAEKNETAGKEEAFKTGVEDLKSKGFKQGAVPENAPEGVKFETAELTDAAGNVVTFYKETVDEEAVKKAEAAEKEKAFKVSIEDLKSKGFKKGTVPEGAAEGVEFETAELTDTEGNVVTFYKEKEAQAPPPPKKTEKKGHAQVGGFKWKV